MALGFPAQTDNSGGRGRRSNNGRQNLHLGVVQVSNFRRNMVIAFLAVAVFGFPMWMLLDRDPPYTFEKVTIDPPHTLSVPCPSDTRERCSEIRTVFDVKPGPRLAACGPGTVYREFKEAASGKLHVIDPVQRIAPPQAVDNQFERTAIVPDNVTPGLTYFRAAVCYNCNPLHQWLRWPVCLHTPEVPFTVVK